LPEGTKVILVATTSKRGDNLNMINCLGNVLARANQNWSVFIKCHPLLPKRDEQALASIVRRHSPLTKCMTFQEELPLSQMLMMSDVMITNSSATGIEAMALGIMPIFFHNPYLYDLSVLYTLSHSVLLAASAPELAAALTAVFQGDDTLARRKAFWEQDLKDLFYRIDTEAEVRLLGFLQNHGNVSIPTPHRTGWDAKATEVVV
jgi:CDP-glycerol glycerophosphotransferase (TagB/SpsB family)